MFGIGITEFMLIMVVTLLVVGPDKLPGIARTLAKTYNEFRRAGNDIKKSVRDLNLESAEELIKGTVNKVVPGRADTDNPGKGSGASASQNAPSEQEPVDMTEEPEWASKTSIEEKKRLTGKAAAPVGGTVVNGKVLEKADTAKDPQAVEPVDFKGPDRAPAPAVTAETTEPVDETQPALKSAPLSGSAGKVTRKAEKREPAKKRKSVTASGRAKSTVAGKEKSGKKSASVKKSGPARRTVKSAPAKSASSKSAPRKKADT